MGSADFDTRATAHPANPGDQGEPEVSVTLSAGAVHKSEVRLRSSVEPSGRDTGERVCEWINLLSVTSLHFTSANLTISRLGSSSHQCTWRIIPRVGTHPGPREIA